MIPGTHSTRKYIVWLLLIVLASGALYLVSYQKGGSYAPSDASAPQQIIERPPYTEEIAAQLAASKGFNHLVSYTEAGFEPQTITVRAGETVRFTNNSLGSMWVAAATEMGSIYPAPGVCGQSAFDICKEVGPGMFYEFTFEKKGTWGYHDLSEPAKTGAVVVE